jgi:hypothetical protein
VQRDARAAAGDEAEVLDAPWAWRRLMKPLSSRAPLSPLPKLLTK